MKKAAPVILLVVGLLQMSGDLLLKWTGDFAGWQLLKAIGAASTASPAGRTSSATMDSASRSTTTVE